jgi:Transposase IS66 family
VRRFTKYWDHLFRFLGYDGVPWNNNCAEHAIKRFSKFRRTSNGVVTEETISDYLAILSICLTWAPLARRGEPLPGAVHQLCRA